MASLMVAGSTEAEEFCCVTATPADGRSRLTPSGRRKGPPRMTIEFHQFLQCDRHTFLMPVPYGFWALFNFSEARPSGRAKTAFATAARGLQDSRLFHAIGGRQANSGPAIRASA